jgi:hypothetical protein
MAWNSPGSRSRARSRFAKACVDGQAAVPAFLGHLERVAPLQHPHARVVDERGQRAERRFGTGKRRVMVGKVGDVEGHGGRLGAKRADGLQSGGKLGVVGGAVQRHGEALARQGAGGPEADAPARSGDECHLSAHLHSPVPACNYLVTLGRVDRSVKKKGAP